MIEYRTTFEGRDLDLDMDTPEDLQNIYQQRFC